MSDNTPSPDPSPTSTDTSSNANLLAQAANSVGAQVINPTPAADPSQLSPGATMYLDGGGDVVPKEPRYVPGRSNPSTGAEAGGTAVQTTTVAGWLNTFYQQIASESTSLQQFSTEAQLAGLVGANANVPQLYAAWSKLVTESYNYYINGQNLTPWDVLANSIPGTTVGQYKYNSGYDFVTGMTSQQAADLAAKAAAKDTNKTTTKSEVDINYTDPDTARYVLNQASQQLLGRTATNDEVANFTRTLNADEANFPKMTQDTQSTSGTTTSATAPGVSDLGNQGQTVVGYDSAGNPIYGPTDSGVGSTTNTNTTGNTTDTVVSLGEQDYTRYGREQLAEDAAKAAPDYGAYQAAGPLFQAFLGTLKGAVPGVGSN